MEDNLTERRDAVHASGWHVPASGQGAPQLKVNVLVTTEKATIAALRTATGLAANLGAEITIISAQVVPWQVPLENPPVAVALLKQKLCRLVYGAGIVGDEVRIQLYLCRDGRHVLQHILRPHSLIVLGGSDHWWSRRERNLTTFLARLGHQVIFVRVRKSEQLDHTPLPVRMVPSLNSFAFHSLEQQNELRRVHK
jgi:hypothetical protein